MKLTTRVAKFTDTDQEDVQINVDKYGKFSLRVPRRITMTCGDRELIEADSIGELQARLDSLIQKYKDYIDPPNKVLIYSFSFANPFGSSLDNKQVTKSIVGFAWAHAIKKSEDLFISDSSFVDVAKCKEDKFRSHWHTIDYSPEMVKTFENISRGVIDIQQMLKEISQTGFDVDFIKILTAPKPSTPEEVMGVL